MIHADTPECEHANVSTYRSLPPRSVCLDCGAEVTKRWNDAAGGPSPVATAAHDDGLAEVIAAHIACSCPALLDTSTAEHVAEQVRILAEHPATPAEVEPGLLMQYRTFPDSLPPGVRARIEAADHPATPAEGLLLCPTCGRAEPCRHCPPAEPDAGDADGLARYLYDREGFHAADSWATETSIQRGRYEALAEYVLASDWLAARVREAEQRALRDHRCRPCGCGWCCANTPTDRRGETHQRTCRPHRADATRDQS